MFVSVIMERPLDPSLVSAPGEKLQVPQGKPERTRAKQYLYLVLTVLWLFPTFGALWIVANGGQPWLRAGSVVEAVDQVSFEEWVAVVLLLAHGVFVWLALRYRRLVAVSANPPAAERQ